MVRSDAVVPPSGGGVRARRHPGATALSRPRLAHAARRLSAELAVLRSEGVTLLVLAAVAVGIGALSSRFGSWVPSTLLSLVIVMGGFALRVRSLLLLYGVVAAVMTYDVVRMREREVAASTVVLLVLTGLLMVDIARRRARLGISGRRGESMLFDLRDRLRAQGEMPQLPPGWGAEVVLRSAYGASFGGDFLVASRSPDGKLLEVALVDVSGKGVPAGTRALLLSGAFGGLLGAMPSDRFLPAANQYLLRQDWDEGFATAAHVVVDLTTGEFVVTGAGHPPPAQFHAGSGRWRVMEALEGPLLGVVSDARYVGERGRLDRGDALLLYTDGLVEVAGRDLSVGIDRLLGHAERLVTRGFRDGARRLVDVVPLEENDDRALVLIWRT